MPDMTSEQIRDVAVRCVEGFLNNKTPLSVGLAKEASANDLNLEQIKRACEVTNTVTHMKLLQLSDDRTIEFPLCKVAEVMASIVAPGTEKRAASGKQVVANSQLPNECQEKQASAHEAFAFSDHEKTLHFIKEAAVNEKVLESLNDRAIVVQSELVKVASEVRNDKAWMDKLSSVIAIHDDKNNRMQDLYPSLSVLISGEPSERRDFGGHHMFKEAELKQVNKLVALYKEARSIVAEKAKRTAMCKRAEDLSQEMTKQAFFTGAARAVGSGLGKATVGLGIGAAAVTGFAAKKAVKAVSSPVGMAVVGDSMTHAANGSAGITRNGAPKDVWDALQH